MMRGLSLTRPWPFAFEAEYDGEPKRVENRSWRPFASVVGTLIALHAAKSWSEIDRAWIANRTGLHVPPKAESPHSQIFAVARLKDYAFHSSSPKVPAGQRRWFFGPCGWLLDDYYRLANPVPCQGRQGLWKLSEEVERQVREQL